MIADAARSLLPVVGKWPLLFQVCKRKRELSLSNMIEWFLLSDRRTKSGMASYCYLWQAVKRGKCSRTFFFALFPCNFHLVPNALRCFWVDMNTTIYYFFLLLINFFRGEQKRNENRNMKDEEAWYVPWVIRPEQLQRLQQMQQQQQQQVNRSVERRGSLGGK